MPVLAIVAFVVALIFFLLALLLYLPIAAAGEPWRGSLTSIGLFFFCAADFLARGGLGG
jgi:energy-converting hydrogenase Eha subunit A